MSESKIAGIMRATSVAMVGASNDPAKVTGRPLAYMLKLGFSGRLFPVNPSRTEVQGLPCARSLRDIGELVDLALIATPAHTVEGVLIEGIEAGIRSFVVFSSGFAELDDEGRKLQLRLSEIAKRHDIAIVGPNCLGVANSATGLMASFNTAMELNGIVRGSFAFVSQSGALGSYWLDMVLSSGIGFSHWITTGNECDVEVGGVLEFLAEDPDTRVIGMYIEDVRDGSALRRGMLRAARAGKPVLIVKSGRPASGAAAAASHTGALAGDDTLFDACFAQYGAARVESITAMIEAARLYEWNAVPRNRKLGVMSVSGGAGVLIADAADAAGLAVEPYSPETQAALAPLLPAFSKPQNPLDLTASIVQNASLLAGTLKAIGEDPSVGVRVLSIGLLHSIAKSVAEALVAERATSEVPIVVIWVGASRSVVEQLETARIPVFTDIPPAIAAIGTVCRIEGARAAAREAPWPAKTAAQSPATCELSEAETKAVLRRWSGVQVPEGVLVRRDDVGVARIAHLQPPLVAKIQAAAMKHKSEHGGVVLKLQSHAAAVEACQRLFGIADAAGIEVEGVLVERMVPFDFELFVGLRRDPIFGPVLVAGRGGIEVELDPDIATLLLPVGPREIEQAIGRLRYARLLRGYRGGPAVDIAACARAIHELASRFTADTALQELEVNPLAVGCDGVWVLDALMTIAKDTD